MLATSNTIAHAGVQQNSPKIMPRLDITGTTEERNAYQFRASGPISTADSKLNDNDGIDGNEVFGGVSTGTDTIVFDGVPTAFTADSPWELTLELNLGAGPVRFMPTHLNAPTITVRSEGAHYWLGVTRWGILLRDTKADDKDQVMDGPNNLVYGNVRGGSEDSWQVWPPMGVTGIADGETEYRNSATSEGWQSLQVVKPTMEF